MLVICMYCIVCIAEGPEHTLVLSCSSHLTPLGMQTKTVNVPAAPPRAGARLNAWGSTSVPTVGMQSEASLDGNADASSQASGDASSVTSKTEDRRAGSTTADDETVPEASSAHGNTTRREAPHTHPGVQVSDFFAHATALPNACSSCWRTLSAAPSFQIVSRVMCQPIQCLSYWRSKKHGQW